MDKGAKKLSTFEKRALATQKTMRNLRRTVLGVGAAIGTAKLAGEFLETAQSIDSLAKTSDKLGIATENLAALRFVGQQTGVEIRTMDMAIQRMTRRLSEAAQGTGEAKNAIKELGLDAQQLAKLNPSQQFQEIAEAMGRIPSQADRVRLSFKLFDSEGVALVNTLAQGKRGIKDLEAQAKSLGITISREEAAKVEEFNDALNSLSNLIGGLKSDIVIRIAPEATKFVDALGEASQGLQLGGGQSGRSLLNKDQWPWTRGLIKGFKGEFEWQKRWTDSMVRGDVSQGIAAGSGAQSPTVPRLSNDAIIKREREESLGRFNRVIGNSLNSVMNPQKIAGAIGKIQEKRDEFLKPYLETTKKGFRDALLRKAIGGGRSDVIENFGAKGDDGANQFNPAFVFRSLNEPIIKGTVEAFRAESLRSREIDIVKQGLAESKKQTKLLTTIAEKPVASATQIAEGGL